MSFLSLLIIYIWVRFHYKMLMHCTYCGQDIRHTYDYNINYAQYQISKSLSQLQIHSFCYLAQKWINLYWIDIINIDLNTKNNTNIIQINHMRYLEDAYEKVPIVMYPLMLMVLSSGLQVTSHIYSIENRFSVWEYLLCRSVTTSILSYIFCLTKKRKMQYREDNQIKIVISSIIWFLVIGLITLFQNYLYMHIVYCLASISIVFYSFSSYFQHILTTPIKYLLCLIMFILGSVLLLGFLFTDKQTQIAVGILNQISLLLSLFLFIMCILVGFCWCLYVQLIVSLQNTAEQQCFYRNIFILIFSSLGYLSLQTKTEAYLLIYGYLLCGILAALSQLLFVYVLANFQQTILLMCAFCATFVFSIFIQIYYFNESLDLWSFIGISIISISIFRSVYIHIQQNNYKGVKQVFPSRYHQLRYQVGQWYGVLGILFSKIFNFQYPYKMVQRGQIGLVERFGKYKQKVREGFWYFNVLTENIIIVNVKTQMMDLNQINAQTIDNVNVKINAASYFQIKNAKNAIYEHDNIHKSIQNLVIGGIRSVIGHFSVQELIEKRASLLLQLQAFCKNRAKSWGIQIYGVLIKQVDFDDDLQDIFASYASEKRIAQTKVINAETQLLSAKMMRQTSDILSSQAAMQIRYIQALQRMASNQNIHLMMLAQNEDQQQVISAYLDTQNDQNDEENK